MVLKFIYTPRCIACCLKKSHFVFSILLIYFHFEEQMHLFYPYAVSHVYEINWLRSWKNEENLKNRTFSMFIDWYNLRWRFFILRIPTFPFTIPDSWFLIPNSYFSTGINQSGDKNGHVRNLIGWSKNSSCAPDFPSLQPGSIYLSYLSCRATSCICHFFCIEHLYGRFP